MKGKSGKTGGLLGRAKEAWLVAGITFLLLLMLEVALSLAYTLRDRFQPSVSALSQDWRAHADAYAGVSWTHQYYKEFEESSVTEWSSYVYWRRKPYKGRYINIDPNGIRRTWRADGDRPGSDPRSVFIFGGSTVWGVGVRDDATIPSFLARKLEEKGIGAEVTNFGESGYVSTQEVIALIGQLQKGNVPDLAIFYDGVNDVYSAYQQRAAGLPHNEYNRVKEFNLTQPAGYQSLRSAFLHRTAEKLAMVRFSRSLLRRLGVGDQQDAAATYWGTANHSIAGEEDLLGRILTVYESNVRTIRALGEAYGFKTLFYWQPTVFDKSHLTPYEQEQRESVEALQPFCRRAYELVSRKGDDGDFRDLCGTFAEVSRPVFIDWCHLSEWGNEAIAEQMADDTAGLWDDRPTNSGGASRQP